MCISAFGFWYFFLSNWHYPLWCAVTFKVQEILIKCKGYRISVSHREVLHFVRKCGLCNPTCFLWWPGSDCVQLRELRSGWCQRTWWRAHGHRSPIYSTLWVSGSCSIYGDNNTHRAGLCWGLNSTQMGNPYPGSGPTEMLNVHSPSSFNFLSTSIFSPFLPTLCCHLLTPANHWALDF